MSSGFLSINKKLANRALKTLVRGYLSFRESKKRISLNYFPTHFDLTPAQTPTVFTELRKEIDALKEHIDGDYCFLDLPEYCNIGDHMIYEGSLKFLSTLPYYNRYQASMQSFQKSRVGTKDIILLQGGGNFGDLWPAHQQFREHVVSSFRKNKIIIFPQTIFFKHRKNLLKAVSVFSAHPNLVICTRDQRSYKIAQDNFTRNTILLIPDMASNIQFGLTKKPSNHLQKVLLMQRNDKELKQSLALPYISNLEIKDWPPYNHSYFRHLKQKHRKHKFYLNEGLLFMANYDLVISTRLHGAIMATLLDIPTIFLDNSYGKNKTYYETWLNTMPNTYFASCPKKLNNIIKEHFPEIIK